LQPTKDKRGKWWPAGSDTFAGRDKVEKGKIVLHSDAFETFARYGWVWGGLWQEIG